MKVLLTEISIRQTDFHKVTKSSILDTLNLRRLLNIQMGWSNMDIHSIIIYSMN